MFTETETRSRGHGLSLDVIKAQADSLEIPLTTGSATWQDYEKIFLKIIHNFKTKKIDFETIEEMEKAGIDASGKEGEYHTVVTNGLIFKRPLELEPGEIILKGGYNFLDVSVKKIQ